MTSIQPPFVIAISAMSREQLACQIASCYGDVVRKKIRLLVPLWLLHLIDEEQIVKSLAKKYSANTAELSLAFKTERLDEVLIGNSRFTW